MLLILFVASMLANVNSQFDFEVRFSNNQSSAGQSSGLVEIYYNSEWWLIASPNWTQSNSQVLCRSLGFPEEEGFTLVAIDDMKLYNSTDRSFTCMGTENGLQYCKQHVVENATDLSRSNVEIACTGLKESTVRLVGGLTAKEGRAEVFHNGEWGTICMNGTVLSDATAICRSVGFDTRFANYERSSRLPEATGRIWIDNLRCDGSESHINECQEISWGSNNCSHSDDIYMHCYLENDIRLMSNVLHGELQIFHGGVWGSVCRSSEYQDQGRNELTAEIACRSLGFADPVVGEYESNVNDKNGNASKVWLSDIKCYGTEKSLIECNHDDWGVDDCTMYNRDRFFVVCMQPVVPLSDEQVYEYCQDRCQNGNCYTYMDNACVCYSDHFYGEWCEFGEYEYPYDDDDSEVVLAILAIFIGSICGVIFLGVIIALLLHRRNKRRSETTSVAYSTNQVNLIPVVQIASQGPHTSVIQPFSQSTVLGAQASFPGTQSKVPLSDENEHIQTSDPPPYQP